MGKEAILINKSLCGRVAVQMCGDGVFVYLCVFAFFMEIEMCVCAVTSQWVHYD